jgi:hypothetical protein
MSWGNTPDPRFKGRGWEGWWCRPLDLRARRPWTWARISGLVHFKSLKVCVRNYFTDILICFYTKKPSSKVAIRYYKLVQGLLF